MKVLNFARLKKDMKLLDIPSEGIINYVIPRDTIVPVWNVYADFNKSKIIYYDIEIKKERVFKRLTTTEADICLEFLENYGSL